MPSPRWQPVPWYPLPYMQMYLDSLVRKLTTAGFNDRRYGLAYFGMFAQTEGIRHPEEIERIHILHYQAWLGKDAKSQLGRPPSKAYQLRLMRALRGWFEWLLAENHITKTPWERIVIGSVHRKATKPLDPSEVHAVFEEHRRQAFSTSPFIFHRREALLAMMFAWGLTNNEILMLNVPNMDMRRDSVDVRFARGERTKHMPYGPELKDVVSRWLKQRSAFSKITEDALFIDNTGGRMTPGNLRKTMIDLGDRAGVDLTVVRMRNTFGANLLKSGTDRAVVQALLGLVDRENVTLYDPHAQQKRDAVAPLNGELAELLGHRPDPEYRRM